MKTFRVNRDAVIVVIGVVLALMLRIAFRDFKSGDFYFFTERWYEIVSGHGFGVFRYEFYDYTPPYLYALFVTARLLPRLSPVFALKIPSILADFVCAWYLYRIARLKYKSGLVPILAAFAVLFAPTVVINSAVWGQTDMLFTAPLVAALYYLLRQKERAVWLAVGLAFAIKPQAVFIAPFLFALLVRRELAWRNIGWAPIVCFATLVPAWVAGRPIRELLTIYSSQGAIQASKLTWRAPNLYHWLPQGHADIFFPAGMIFGAAIALLLVAVTYKSRVRPAPPLLIGLALASVLIMPYVLPGMHERYFFTADVFAIIFAFYVSRYIWLPILIGTVSLLAYQPFLFKREIIPMPWLAFALLVAIVALARWLLLALYPRAAVAPLNGEVAPASETSSGENLYPSGDPIFVHRPNGEPSHGITQDVVDDFRKLQQFLLKNSQGIRYVRPPEVTFLTYNTSSASSLIERCYKSYGIEDAVVLGRGLENWDWYSKVSLVLEYLESEPSVTPFVVVTDANDVLMINDPAPLVKRFLSYHTEVLFCNTFVDWPPNQECRDFETATYPDKPLHGRLSAGAYMARTASLLGYLRQLQAARAADEPWTIGFHGKFDDQLAWRHLHRQEYPRIKIDHLSRIFRRYDIFRGTECADVARHPDHACAIF